jgi:protein-tyrosine phosphatase
MMTTMFETKHAPSVLMVCLGNICRSPLAEAALRQVAARERIVLHVDSAGTGDWHVGHPPDHRAQEVALRLGGVDISGLRARQFETGDFYRFDHILAMDDTNLTDLQALMPSDATARLSLLLEHLPGQQVKGVADPYYGDVAAFETTWWQVSAASAAFLKRLNS